MGQLGPGGINTSKRQLFVDTFPLLRKISKSEKAKPGAKSKSTKPKKPRSEKKGAKPAPEKAKGSDSQRTPLTPEEKRQRQRENRQRPERKEAQRLARQKARQRAKEFGLCRDCFSPSLPGRVRCGPCAESNHRSHRTSQRQAPLAVTLSCSDASILRQALNGGSTSATRMSKPRTPRRTSGTPCCEPRTALRCRTTHRAHYKAVRTPEPL